MMFRRKKGNLSIAIDGIHLWKNGDYTIVEVDINGKWHKVICESGNFSHIIEPDGIRDCIKWRRTLP